jgi:SAM-dependent methyltransferase/predicted O-methyltransferase YrrM
VLIEIDPEHVPDLHVTVSAALQLFAPIKSIQIVFQVPTEPRLETAMALKQLCISVCPEGSSLPEIVLLPASTTSEMLTLCRVQAGGDAVSSAAAIIKMCAARDAMLPKAAPPPPPPTSAPSTAVDPSRQLPAEGTFFRHLLEQGRRNAEGTGASPETHRSERMPTSVPALLSFYAQALQHIQPERVLDVGVGFGGWAMLVREICDERQGRIHRENWRVRVEAVTSAPHDVEEYHHFFYDSIHVGEPLEVMSRLDGSWELVVLGHEHFTDPALTGPLLDRALVAGAYVIATTPIRPENDGSRTGELGLVELLERDPLRYQVSPDERTAAFLFSAYDPLCLRPDAPEAVFERIFNDNSWGERESRSGPGSSLAQTATLRRELPALLAKVGAHSVLDAPCGDWNWMRHVDLGPLKYVGADIVPRLVAENRARWGSPHRRFLVLDITADTLPQVDVIICRDALVHLSFDDAARAVANFCRSRSTYLLTTTFPNHRPNAPAATGEWRPLNLELGPFFFPAPIAVLNEDCTEGDGTYADKSLGLWLLEDLRQ